MIFEDPQFVKTLDAWLANNDQKAAQALSLYKSRVPPMFSRYSGSLYRGMIVDQKFMTDAESGKLATPTAKFSSWSKDKTIATKFAKDSKYKTSSKSGIPILVTLKNPLNSVVMDINGICLFAGYDMLQLGLDDLSLDSAIKEQEVLLSGVKITKSMITKL